MLPTYSHSNHHANFHPDSYSNSQRNSTSYLDAIASNSRCANGDIHSDTDRGSHGTNSADRSAAN